MVGVLRFNREPGSAPRQGEPGIGTLLGSVRRIVEDEGFSIHPGKTGSSSYLPLAACYKQLNSSVGRFGTVTHGVYMSTSRGVSYYEVCVVPPYYASSDTGTNPLMGGTWNVTLNGSISSASWKAQVTMPTRTSSRPTARRRSRTSLSEWEGPVSRLPSHSLALRLVR